MLDRIKILGGMLLVLCMLALSACGAQPAVSPAETATDTLWPTLTVPPLPTLTPWSTKTPKPTLTPTITLTPTATPLACWQTHGEVTADVVPSTLLIEDVDVLVYLPPCYQQQPERYYPTLYMIHGQGFDQDQWMRLGITDLADEWIAFGESLPFIIVMPYVSDWDEPSEFAFGRAMVEEVLPYIESHYRAVPQRLDRAVGGLSRGASWSLHLGLKYPDIFASLGAHSLPIFYEDAPKVPIWLANLTEDQTPRIYLDYAERDQSAIRQSTEWLIKRLEEYNVPYTFSTAQGTHDENYWSSQLESYLRFYVDGWMGE